MIASVTPRLLRRMDIIIVQIQPVRLGVKFLQNPSRIARHFPSRIPTVSRSVMRTMRFLKQSQAASLGQA
jgi:hypothetical protein